MGLETGLLDLIVSEICKNANYARMDKALVEKITQQEMAKRKSVKDVVKAARSKLHQIGTVYLESPKPLSFDFSTISSEQANDLAFQKNWALPYLGQHASTKERLPFVEEFYKAIFSSLPPVTQILDLACGLNPLFRPWMPISPQTTYLACDIFNDVIDLLNGYFECFGFSGQAEICDLSSAVPSEPKQVVFLLKTLPCLEQIQKGIGEKVLNNINAEVIVLSFPAKSLGGKNKGMVVHYDAYLKSILSLDKWRMEVLPFMNETVYLLSRRAS